MPRRSKGVVTKFLKILNINKSLTSLFIRLPTPSTFLQDEFLDDETFAYLKFNNFFAKIIKILTKTMMMMTITTGGGLGHQLLKLKYSGKTFLRQSEKRKKMNMNKS